MKRLIAALTVVALTGTLVTASAEGMQYGIRAGFNMNSISIKDGPDVDMGTGFGAGLVMQYPLSSQLSIVPEVNFMYRTLGKFEVDLFIIPVKVTFSEMALSVPCMIQYRVSEGSPLYLSGGVQLDIPFGSKVKASLFGVSESEDWDTRNSIDFGFPLGLGYMINPNMAIDFRFVLYVTKLEDDDVDVKLMSFGLGFNYLF